MRGTDTMMAHPLALQLRNLQTLMEIGVDHNSTVVFPAPLMSTIQELGAFLAREAAAVTPPATPAEAGTKARTGATARTRTGTAASDAASNTNGVAAARHPRHP